MNHCSADLSIHSKMIFLQFLIDNNILDATDICRLYAGVTDYKVLKEMIPGRYSAQALSAWKTKMTKMIGKLVLEATNTGYVTDLDGEPVPVPTEVMRWLGFNEDETIG